jgi:hypothetical protein
MNLIDTADAYGPGVSERLIAEALHPYPKDVVIATKGGRTRQGPGACSERERDGLAFLLWMPLARGALAGRRSRLRRIAVAHEATPAQIALAWLLHRSQAMLPIPRHVVYHSSRGEPRGERSARDGRRARGSRLLSPREHPHATPAVPSSGSATCGANRRADSVTAIPGPMKLANCLVIRDRWRTMSST